MTDRAEGTRHTGGETRHRAEGRDTERRGRDTQGTRHRPKRSLTLAWRRYGSFCKRPAARQPRTCRILSGSELILTLGRASSSGRRHAPPPLEIKIFEPPFTRRRCRLDEPVFYTSLLAPQPPKRLGTNDTGHERKRAALHSKVRRQAEQREELGRAEARDLRNETCAERKQRDCCRFERGVGSATPKPPGSVARTFRRAWRARRTFDA